MAGPFDLIRWLADLGIPAWIATMLEVVLAVVAGCYLPAIATFDSREVFQNADSADS